MLSTVVQILLTDQQPRSCLQCLTVQIVSPFQRPGSCRHFSMARINNGHIDSAPHREFLRLADATDTPTVTSHYHFDAALSLQDNEQCPLRRHFHYKTTDNVTLFCDGSSSQQAKRPYHLLIILIKAISTIQCDDKI